MTAHGPLEPNRAAEYVKQAAEGSATRFRCRTDPPRYQAIEFVLDRAGVVRLLDLGLARFLVDSRRNQGVTEQFDANVILGTVDYMAPEQAIDSSRVDIRADVYSLGCTLYFLLTGKPVFEADAFAQKMLAHQMRDPAPIRDSRPEVPAGLEAVVKKMIAKKPEHRYQTPADVIAALAEFVIPATSLPDTARMPKKSARSFRLGLCPAPPAVRMQPLSDSMMVTPGAWVSGVCAPGVECHQNWSRFRSESGDATGGDASHPSDQQRKRNRRVHETAISEVAVDQRRGVGNYDRSCCGCDVWLRAEAEASASRRMTTRHRKSIRPLRRIPSCLRRQIRFSLQRRLSPKLANV